MTQGMRITNVVVMLFLAIAGATLAWQHVDTEPARAFGSLLGIFLWGAPFHLARRALAADSSQSHIAKARTANRLLIGLTLITALFMSFSSGARGLSTLIIGIPGILNLVALKKRQAELQDGPLEDADNAGEPPQELNTPAAQSAHYLLRHWRGELPLAHAYWINGSLIVGGSTVILSKLLNSTATDQLSLRQIAMLSIGFLLFSMLAWLWSSVGIWRSARQNQARGGSAGWAVVAQAMVVIGALTMLGRLSNTAIPQLQEFTRIATGNDPLGKASISLMPNGQAILIKGMLGEGTAENFRQIVETAPAATSVLLESGGGRLHEARKIADLVRARHLNTYTEAMCASACTYIFLAGKDRAATPNARIGFHQASFVGMNNELKNEAMANMSEVYRDAGLPEAFVQRIRATAAEDMWFPTRDELIRAKVLTRTSLGGENSVLGLQLKSREEFLLAFREGGLFQTYEKRFPGTIEQMADQAWAAKQSGGTDTDIQNAARSAIAGIMPKLLKTADDRILNQFAQLFVKEVVAARAISAEACGLLLESRLNISATLPREIVEAERQFVQDALNAPPRGPAPGASLVQARQAIGQAVRSMPANYLKAVNNPPAYRNQPALLCDSMESFYRNILALPEAPRRHALQGLFQIDQ
ncbi:MAG: hypothetical protein WAV95_08030 [Azonexus sp.]